MRSVRACFRRHPDGASTLASAAVPPTTPVNGGRRRKARGQSLLEFAVVLPVLALIFAAGADFGRAFTAYIAVSSAAREGAAFGMLSTANANNGATIQQVVSQEAGSLFGSSVSGTSTTGTDTTGNTYVQVTATYTFRPLMPIPPIPGAINMTRTVRMRVIS